MKIKVLISTLFTLVLVVVFHSDALAWGPGVHIAVGNYLLSNLALIPASMAGLISSNPNSFLYGCLSADIFIGKGCRYTPEHSHNWTTGFKLLESAQTRQVKAYAYGYLSHLAADTIAHNYYVPNSLWLTPGKGRLSHIYLEMQADQRVDWCRKQARNLFRTAKRPEDISLLSTMDKKKFTFLLKKHLYKGSLSICDRKSWNSSLHFMDRNLPLANNETYLHTMLDLSLRAALDLLKNTATSPVRSLDPIGSRPLSLAKQIRRTNPLRASGRNETKPLFPLDPSLKRLADLN
ncbi:MAG: zinc dependent phospholipase C family protein [Desulfovibrionales bacterium]